MEAVTAKKNGTSKATTARNTTRLTGDLCDPMNIVREVQAVLDEVRSGQMDPKQAVSSFRGLTTASGALRIHQQYIKIALAAGLVIPQNAIAAALGDGAPVNQKG